MPTTKALGLLSALVLLGSCSKPPKASFTSDKEEYKNGETMQMTNTSENAFTYNWTTSNSLTQYSSKDAAIITNGAGDYLVTLTAYSRNGGKSNQASKTIKVLPGDGQVMFYTNDNSKLSYSVTMDGLNLGTPTQTFATEPSCGTAGCITATLSEGQHSFFYSSPQNSFSYFIQVEANVCKKVKIP